ncbi:MAG: T9SS type A sorting domain-containing protein, partial [Bacteroidia bacterium]|nr:T9SS type A sorting domain-containing protein [Bacteroidia bacterium]
FTSPFDDYSVAMVRYNNDGSMDTAFGTAGTQYQKCGGIYDEGANGVVIQPDGKIVIIGSLVSTTGMMSAISCNTDGSLDATFNGGSTGHSNVSFGTNIDSYGKAIALQSDGKIVIAGYRYASGTTNPDFAVARLNGTVTFSRSEFSNNGISIYPNPANHNINIKGIEGKTVIKLYDVLGNLVMDASTSSGLTKENKTTLNTNQLTEGIYTVVTENNSGCTISKVVINK